MLPLPQEFRARMLSLLGDEYEAFEASLDLPPDKGLRCNPLKLNVGEFKTLFPGSLTALPWCPTGFSFTAPAGFQPGKHPYHAAGLYYLQDPAAMAAAELLAPQPGERVLDLAAAPGGKATHLAALMENRGVLLANDIHPQRVWELAGNLERWGAICSAITNETPARLSERFPGFFDRVLVDAPCSGEALFRRSDEARRAWSIQAVQQCAVRQQDILAKAAQMVRPGGWLLYATCTFNPIEDEAVILNFLDDQRNFSLVQTSNVESATRGRPEWVPDGAQLERGGLFRIWPHISPGDGHFLALLQRLPGHIEAAHKEHKRKKQPNPPEEAKRYLNNFVNDTLREIEFRDRLQLSGSYLYETADQLGDLSELKVIHPGRWLGIMKKNRFEPSHALALSLKMHQAQNVCNLEKSQSQLAAYLRGESFIQPGKPGWVLVCVDGYPIGWGKRVNGLIKSHYPKGLRWLT